jgi:hypothetical protein
LGIKVINQKKVVYRKEDMKTEEKARNPETGRWIRKDGALYKKLLESGKITGRQDTKKSPVYKPPKNYTVLSKRKPYPVDKSEESWMTKKPETKPERTRVLQKCGKSCFLVPDQLKFPICNKDAPPCKYNCRGLKAASSRAGEWKYTRVLEKSKELSAKFGCYKKKKSV